MPTYATVKKQVPLHLCHVCSCCRSPVVLSTQMEVTSVTDNSGLSARTVNARIAKTLEALQLCGVRQEALGSLGVKPDLYWDAVMIPEFAAPCPICGSREPWQKNRAAKEDFEALRAENYPQLFFDDERADLWARARLQKQLEALAARSESSRDAEYAAVCREEAELQAFVADPQRRAPLLALDAEFDALEKEYKSLGLFALKKKENLAYKQEDVRRRKSEAEALLKLEDKRALRKIKMRQYRKAALQTPFDAFDGKAEILEASLTRVYRLRRRQE